MNYLTSELGKMQNWRRLVQKSLLCTPRLLIFQKSKWMPEFHRFHFSRWTFIFEHISSQMVYSSCICWRFPATTTKYWRHIFVMRKALPTILSCCSFMLCAHSSPASLHSVLPPEKLLQVQQWITPRWFNGWRGGEITQSSNPPRHISYNSHEFSGSK